MNAGVSACTASARRVYRVVPRTVAIVEINAICQRRTVGAVPGHGRYSTASNNKSFENVVRDARRDFNVPDSKDPTQSRSIQKQLQRRADSALNYYDDPWQIGQHIEILLRGDRYDEALIVTQKASRGKDMTVLWNHLIQYQMQNRLAPRQALKVFNEMKKRAQLPNVRTYTILFHGLKESKHPRWALTEALKHYNALIASPRLEANAYHMNAVLALCAKAEDLDQLFLISRSSNESNRAPSSFTYAIILNALRHNDADTVKMMPLEQRTAHATKIANQAKGLWSEVMEKWRNGRFVIDEALVCSMGRVLMLQTEASEKLQLFDLLEQTMQVPNLCKNPNSPLISDPSTRGIASQTDLRRPARDHRGHYVLPGQNTLALVLMALATTKQTKLGIKYWNLMVRHFGIVPDRDVWFRLFGMLKRSNSSAHAAAVIEYLPKEHVNGRFYQLVMRTCVGDYKNPTVMENANQVLDESLKRLRTPDLETLRMYLRASLVSHSEMRKQAQAGDLDAAIAQYGRQITGSLVRMWEPFRKLHKQTFEGAEPKDTWALAAQFQAKSNVMALGRLMCSAFDKVTHQDMLPKSELEELRSIAADLNREVVAFYASYKEMQANIRSKTGESKTDESKTDDAKATEPSGDGEPTGPRRSDLWGADYVPQGDYIWDVRRARELRLQSQERDDTSPRSPLAEGKLSRGSRKVDGRARPRKTTAEESLDAPRAATT